MRFSYLAYTAFLSAFWLASPGYVQAQGRTDPWLKQLLQAHASPLLQEVLNHPDSFRYQLIYTRIDRDQENKPHFTSYYLNVDADRYFNPASMVKLPVAALALEKLDSLQIPGLDRHTTMLTDSGYAGQIAVSTDTSAENGLPSIDQYIRRIFLVSDNDAYNRLYEFVGQGTLNRRLWQMGYTGSRITRRFMPMTEEQNRHTNPIRFVNRNKRVYAQPAAWNRDSFDFSQTVKMGRAHYDRDEKYVNEPMDFTTHNKIPLDDLRQMEQAILFPESLPPAARFRLTENDYRFLRKYMSMRISESRHPAYDSSEYFDSYTKFFLFKAGRSRIPSYIRVFNKTGWSYGFLTDVAYIVDFRNQAEFMLSGTIYVNSDGVLNDDHYDYESIGYPFFKEVGDIIYQYERNRFRRFAPDLSEFEFNYNQ